MQRFFDFYSLKILRSILFYEIIILCITLVTEQSFAQNLHQKKSHVDKTLPVLEINATRSSKKLVNVPASLSKVSQKEILLGLPQLSLDESLTNIPGVFFQNQFNSAQDLRVSIRGFGARSAFGVRGIKVLVDGISYTLPDGQTQLDSIDPGIIDSIEVLRSPSSSLYGQSSGGVISITTKEGNPLQSKSEAHQELGQFGLKKNWLNLSGVSGNLNYRFYTSHLEWDGYRNHSSTENTLMNGKFRLKIGSGSDLTLIFSHLHSPKAEDPGALTKPQAESNSKQANSTSITYDVGEKIKDGRVALIYNKHFSPFHKFSLTTHLNHRLFKNKLPYTSGGRVEFERWAPGIEARSIFDLNFFDSPARLIAGADLSFQNDDRKRFDNNNGATGDKTLDRLETVQSIGPYLRAEWRSKPRLDYVAGIRYDRVRFELDDAFLDDGDQSDDKTFSEFSGTVGSIFHWNESMHFYANVASAFETPTTTELAKDPDGGSGFNSNLKSQSSVSYEIGLKRSSLEGPELDLALFIIRSHDELISYEVSGSTFYKNSGQSRRVGLEAGISHHLMKSLKAALSYTFSNFKFTEFDDSGVDQSGHLIPGIPEHRISFILNTFSKSGWFARSELQHVSAFFVDNGNTVKNSDYTTSRISFGYKKKMDKFIGSAYLGLNNLFDEKYNANTRINASGNRYFEPAPPFNVFGGVSFSYLVHP
jgi:iron complex outermembrane recepter protein